MPIPIADLDAPQASIEESILAFLQAHPGEAFNAKELILSVERLETASLVLKLLMEDPHVANFVRALEALVQDGRVCRGTFRWSGYYYVKDLPLPGAAKGEEGT